MLDVNQIPGMSEEDSALTLISLMEDYGRRQAEESNQFSRQMSDWASGAAGQDRHLMRTSYGQALAELAPEVLGMPQRMAGMSMPTVDYEYDLMEALRPYLEELQMGQMRYG